MNKIILITGATSGIGEATALLLSRHNFDLILTGRRAEKLKKLKQKIESEGDARVLTLNFDIRNRQETTTAIEAPPEEWKNIDILINNATLQPD